MRNKARVEYLVSLTGSVLLAGVLGSIIMVLTGHAPLEAWGALFAGAFGDIRLTSPSDFLSTLLNRNFSNTLYKSAQLCITGLATAVASQAGIFNVGGEGQMFLGALASAYFGALLTGVSPWLALPACLLAAVAAGALYALIPALLKVKLHINEVITTILMNSIAIYFCNYMSTGPLKDPTQTKGTAKIAGDLMFSKITRGSNLTESVFYIAIISLLVWYIMSRTTAGFEMKLSGQNSRFARFSGIKADKLAIIAMLVSGAMCGLLGMFETFGVQGRFKPDFSNEFYFDGMLVAMIMRYRPLGIILMSFFFGILKTGAIKMQSQVGVSSELIMIVQSIIIFFMAAEEGVMAEIRALRTRRHAAQSIRKEG